MQVRRVLDVEPVGSLEAHLAIGGGEGLKSARRVDPVAVVDTVADAGLRGRGGAGFPTGVKWRTVAGFASPDAPTTVVVNAAEGEPGSFKDRAILRGNPYRVLEGALIAAHAVGASRVVVAVKSTFRTESTLMSRAIADIDRAGWTDGVAVDVVACPSEYLVGEETALLEVLDGRAPFPRVTPPWRRGIDEIGDGVDSPARLELGALDGAVPPALVNNVETMANVADIVARGPGWFREIGTDQCPGSVVCTVSGDVRRAIVVELPMGTPLAELLELAGGAKQGRRLVAAVSGVANRFLPADRFDAPLSYEGMAQAGSGLGAAGFMVFDDSTDLVAVAAGMSRFLAVESCGQCTPCKQDGLAIADVLERVTRSEAAELDLAELASRARTVANEARCFLASQHELVATSALELFREELDRHITGGRAGRPVPVAPIADIVDGDVVLDLDQAAKQPDWSHDAVYSGKSPADLIDQRQTS